MSSGISPVWTHLVMSLQYPFMVPPKSHSTISPLLMTRSPGWWCGLAAFSPAATIAKFTLSWPSAMSRAEMSAETCASVRPTSGICPACNCAATLSAAAAAAASASISAWSLRVRSGAVTVTDLTHRVAGRCVMRSTRNRDHIWSPTATQDASPSRPCASATGSSVSSHGTVSNTPGTGTTRGASSRGITSIGIPCAARRGA